MTGLWVVAGLRVFVDPSDLGRSFQYIGSGSHQVFDRFGRALCLLGRYSDTLFFLEGENSKLL